MKTFLIITVIFLAFASIVQNDTILRQRQTIIEMRSNPACMIAPAAPASSPNPLPGRRTI